MQVQTISYNNISINKNITFTAMAHGGKYLRKLAEYNVPDFYTGQKMMPHKKIEEILKNDIFNKPLIEMINVISKYENYLRPIEKKFFLKIKQVAQTKPNIKLEDAIKILEPEHKAKLLRKQQYIFEKLIRLACKMPQKEFGAFSELMNITTRRLLNDPIVTPFSEKEFLYKLSRLSNEIIDKNDRKETKAIKKLLKTAHEIFPIKPKILGKNKNLSRNALLKRQMQPKILTANSGKIQLLRQFVSDSPLAHNKEIQRLFDNTSARIHGFPYIEHFGRKSFIHNLRKITQKLEDKTLAENIISTASQLPTSINDLSAFIVKYADEPSSKIGYYMIKNSCVSVDHLVPKNRGGHGRLANFVLCCSGINAEKTNIPFDNWVRMHPNIYKFAQKYIDCIINLYNNGILKKIELPRKYITDLTENLIKISPKEKPIILDISKLQR